MTIIATAPFYHAGSLVAAGPTQLTYSADAEADLVRRGLATWAGRPPNIAGLQPVHSQTDASGSTALVVAGGRIDNLSVGIPKGVGWLSDTINGFDIYAQGFVRTPTIFFDPSATGSIERGTLANPYTTQANVQRAVAGNMSGQVLGFKRGTTLRVTGTNGLYLNGVHGASGSPLILCPYGDAESLPIITGAAIYSDWTVENAGANIWKRTIGATEHDCWQDDVRLYKKAWNTNAVTTLTADGTSTYSSSVLYIRPYNGENPNLGQMEVSVCDFALKIALSDVSATGYVHLAGLDVMKARASTTNILVPSIVNVSTADDVQVVGCRFSGAGVDASTASGSDGIVIYGPSNGFLTGLEVRGNYCAGNLNNAIETSYTDGAIFEFNQDTDHGGNTVELWASNKNAVVRYNIGESHDTSGRVNTTYHMGGVWITDYTNSDTPTSGRNHTTNINNTVEFNYFHNMRTQGVDIYGGTGNKIRHNTLHQDAGFLTNRLINFATNSGVTGTVSCEISNNFLLYSGGNQIAIDIVQGAGITNDQSVSITSTVTGDNNYYCGHPIATAPRARINKSAIGPATFGSTYKTAAAPFDANSTMALTSVDGGTYIESDGSPSATFPGIGTGKTSLTGIGNRYLHGEAYNPAAPTIGAMV